MKLLHQDATEQTVEFATKWVFGIWFLIIAFHPFYEMSNLPRSTFEPVGFLIRHWPEPITQWIISRGFLIGLKVGLIGSLICILWNKFRTPASIIFCILLTAEQGIIRSWGYVGHQQINLMYAAYILTFFTIFKKNIKASDYGKSHPDFNLNSIPLLTIVAVMCISYMLVGFPRIGSILFRGFSFDSIIYLVVEDTNRTRAMIWDIDGYVLQYKWLRTFLIYNFPISTMFEVFAPLCLIFRWYRIAFLIFMIPFHFFIWIFMGIFFWEHIVFFLLFINYTPFLEKYKRNKYLAALLKP